MRRRRRSPNGWKFRRTNRNDRQKKAPVLIDYDEPGANNILVYVDQDSPAQGGGAG